MSFAADTLGTPLVRLARFAPDTVVYGKAEFMMPTGSTFDRVAGRLLVNTEGAVTVAGSGSPALAFAAAATAQARSMKAIVLANTLPEHLDLLRRYPVEVVTIDGELEDTQTDGAIFGPDVIDSVAEAFEATLGAELAAMLEVGAPVTLVAPVLSGALLLGCGRALSAAGHSVQTVGTLRPEAGTSLQDGVRRVGPDFLTRTVRVTDAEAHETRLELARKEGVLVGMGAAAAARVAASLGGEAQIVTILVDAGDRYFSVDRKLKG